MRRDLWQKLFCFLRGEKKTFSLVQKRFFFFSHLKNKTNKCQIYATNHVTNFCDKITELTWTHLRPLLQLILKRQNFAINIKFYNPSEEHCPLLLNTYPLCPIYVFTTNWNSLLLQNLKDFKKGLDTYNETGEQWNHAWLPLSLLS